MIRDDLMPVRAVLAPPDTFDEAVARVSNLAEGSLLGLVGTTYIDVDQLKRALEECKIKGEFELLCDSGPIQTWRGSFTDPVGNKFEIIANSWSELSCQIVNVRFAEAAMDSDMDAVKLIHRTLKKEERTTVLHEPPEKRKK